MKRRHWNRIQPINLNRAIELCLEHARVKHNRSVDRVAELMGLTSKWTLYKWMESGKLPAVQIQPFEMACGINYVTGWLAASAGCMLVQVPIGRDLTEGDMLALHDSFSAAMNLLTNFFAGKAEVEETMGALTELMQRVAWHRGNVEKARQPELDLFGEEEL